MALILKTNITGLSHYNPNAIESIVEEYYEFRKHILVELKRDPTNRYDSNATGIIYNGEMIGWIPKSKNKEVAAAIDANLPIKAFVSYCSSIRRPIYDTEIQLSVYDLEDNIRITAQVKELGSPYTATTNSQINTQKEEPFMTKIVDNNKQAATTAVYLEGGRIALNQVTKFAVAKSPLMIRGYLDTPFGKLVLANALKAAQEQFRPTDTKLKKLADASMAVAYQEVYQTFDIEGFINEFVDNASIKEALRKVDTE